MHGFKKIYSLVQATQSSIIVIDVAVLVHCKLKAIFKLEFSQ